MDLQMPELDGAAATRRIRAEHEDVQVLVLTTYDTTRTSVAPSRPGRPDTCSRMPGVRSCSRPCGSRPKVESVLSPAVAKRVIGRMRAPTKEALSSRE
jgi:DNA-binding NarL/FixJ family response regulator